MLKIVVLVKQVPNTTQVKIDPVTHNLVREGVPSIVNPFDMFAIEEGIRLKERFGGKLYVLSMGPAQANEVIKYAMAMGADEGVLLSDRAFAGSDTLATSYALAQAVRKIGDVDIVITGRQAADGDTAQVPCEMAEHLDIGCVAYVTEVRDIKNGMMTVVRDIDVASIEIDVALPAVITVCKGMNEPRLPRIADMVEAAEKPISVLNAAGVDADPDRLSVTGSPTQVLSVFSPEKNKIGIRLDGKDPASVKKMIDELYQRKIMKQEV